MINLERKLGIFTLRIWGLILNLFGNALLLYGAVGMIRDGSRIFILILGIVITVFCIIILARPSTDESI